MKTRSFLFKLLGIFIFILQFNSSVQASFEGFGPETYRGMGASEKKQWAITFRPAVQVFSFSTCSTDHEAKYLLFEVDPSGPVTPETQKAAQANVVRYTGTPPDETQLCALKMQAQPSKPISWTTCFQYAMELAAENYRAMAGSLDKARFKISPEDQLLAFASSHLFYYRFQEVKTARFSSPSSSFEIVRITFSKDDKKDGLKLIFELQNNTSNPVLHAVYLMQDDEIVDGFQTLLFRDNRASISKAFPPRNGKTAGSSTSSSFGGGGLVH
ncbi:hypothetical protein ACWJJH_15760 [Endozoicomonadaceae bacterium StTr2]